MSGVFDPLAAGFENQDAVATNGVPGLIPLQFPVAGESVLELPALRIGRTVSVKLVGPDKLPRSVARRQHIDLRRSGERLEG